MSITTYQNEYGNEVSLAQVGQLTNYYEVTINDNNQKITNTFENGVLVGMTYTVNSENDIAPILQSNPNVSFEFSSIVNGYNVWESQSYRNGLISYRSKSVSDSNGNGICLQTYDVNTNLPVYIDTLKTYYDESGTDIYEFVYNNDGSCFSISQRQITGFGAEFLASQIGIDSDITFTWTGFEYYQNAEPLVPAS